MTFPEISLKILTLGESGVGKSCLMTRYTESRFIKSHLTTIGVDYKIKVITIDSKKVRLKIWDTAGQEKFRNITQQYYKCADGILLVFDLSDAQSFNKINDWMKQIELNTKPGSIGLVLVGNKCDSNNKVITKEEGENLAENFGIKYYETSALDNINVLEVFEHLTREIIKIKNIPNDNINASMNNSKSLSDKNENKQSEEEKEGKKCC